MSYSSMKAGLLKRKCPCCASPNREDRYYVLRDGLELTATTVFTTGNSTLCEHKWHNYVPHKLRAGVTEDKEKP